MKRTAFAIALLAVPALSACVVIESDSIHDDVRVDIDHGTAGTVYGASIHLDHVEFMVTSNGCTDETYFNVDVKHRDAGEATLTLDRIRTDPCKALIAEGTTVSWSFEELGLAPGTEVTIANRVVRR